MAQKTVLDSTGYQHTVDIIKAKFATIEQGVNYKGNVATISNLPTISGSSVHIGDMYNVVTGGAITADFVDYEAGKTKTIADGSNVICANVGTAQNPVKKWDSLPGFFDAKGFLAQGTSFPANPSNNDTFLYMGNDTYTYDAVTPEGTENPSEEGWYEYDSQTETYSLSQDTSVQQGTTYYEKNEQYKKCAVYYYNGSAWVIGSGGGGDTIVPITNAEIDSMWNS